MKKDFSHVNLLDIVPRFDENANSRVLARLFEVRLNGQYVVFQSFVNRFFGDAFGGEIRRPDILNERHRIDVLVQEEGFYAFILENKIYEAVQQKCQLASYIRDLRKDGFTDEQIYVIYLPPTGLYPPNVCSWTLPNSQCKGCEGGRCKTIDPKYYLEPLFSKRYRCIDFRDHILPWLKEDVLPLCIDKKQELLKSAVIQYIDYLEGLFFFLTINNDITMEVEQLIRERLGLTDENCKNFDKIAAQVKDIKELLERLKQMEVEFNEKAMKDLIGKWRDKYPGREILDSISQKNRPSVALVYKHKESGIKMQFFVRYDARWNYIYCGIKSDKKEDKEKLTYLLSGAMKNRKEYTTGSESAYYCYTSFAETERKIDDIIDLLKDVIE